jgi:uncharacterized protein YjbI with pentapeptide repeats
MMVNLQKACLYGAILESAWLSSANLQGAQLGGSNLECAILDAANLQGAFLFDVQFQNASLYLANLQGACMTEANLQNVILIGANLIGVRDLTWDQLASARGFSDAQLPSYLVNTPEGYAKAKAGHANLDGVPVPEGYIEEDLATPQPPQADVAQNTLPQAEAAATAARDSAAEPPSAAEREG